MHTGHTERIQLPFPTPGRHYSIFSSVLCKLPHMGDNIRYLSCCVWLVLLKTMLSSPLYSTASNRIQLHNFYRIPSTHTFFLECIYRNGSAGLCDRHALSIVWYVWAATVFHSSLHPESLFYFLPQPHPEVCLLAILTGARYYVTVVFSCVFLENSWHLGDNCTEYFLFIYWPFVSLLLRITYSDHLSVCSWIIFWLIFFYIPYGLYFNEFDMLWYSFHGFSWFWIMLSFFN